MSIMGAISILIWFVQWLNSSFQNLHEQLKLYYHQGCLIDLLPNGLELYTCPYFYISRVSFFPESECLTLWDNLAIVYNHKISLTPLDWIAIIARKIWKDLIVCFSLEALKGSSRPLFKIMYIVLSEMNIVKRSGPS